MKQKIILALICLAAGYFLGKWKPSTGNEAAATDNTYVVKRGDLTVSLNETGVLKAKNFRRISSGLRRSAKITYLVKEGSRVSQGDILAKFDANELNRELATMEQKIRAAEAKRETARSEIEIQKLDGQNEINKAKLAYEEAQKDLKKYLEGEFPLAEREKNVKVEEAAVKLERARQKFGQMPELVKDGFVTPEQMKEKEIEVKKAVVEYDTAKSELELLTKYTKPLETQKKQATIAKAFSELNAGEKQTETKLKQKQLELDSSILELEHNQAELEELKQELAKMEIKSPLEGLVIYGDPDYTWGESVEVGKEVWGSHTIMTIPDLSEMQISLRIHEVDIRSISLNMPVTATMEAAGGLSLPGTITKIAELANVDDAWSGDSDVRHFDVEVTLTGKNSGLKPGTTAKVEIGTYHLQKILYLPPQAIHASNDNVFCYVLSPDGWKVRPIEVGMSNDTSVEIKAGIEEGETIATAIPINLPDKH